MNEFRGWLENIDTLGISPHFKQLNQLTERQREIINEIFNSDKQLIADLIRSLYEDDPCDALATNLDLNTVTNEDILAIRSYCYHRTQELLERQKRTGWLTVFRGDKRVPTEVTSVTLQLSTAQFYAKRYRGNVQRYRVHSSKILGASELRVGTFAEAELIVHPADLHSIE